VTTVSDDRDPGLVAPDVRVGGRRILLTPHNCFACGRLNVHGLQLELHAADDRCWTELTLPGRFEGWEGIAHGGIIATILDEVMGWAIIGTDVWGVTARMTLEFKRPVAVGGRYRAEGWVVRARRRLVESAAHLLDAEGGEVLATAEALYVGVSEERKRELKARYAYALLREDDEPPGADGADPPAAGDEPPAAGDEPSAAGAPGELARERLPGDPRT
jgi:acyl-coenzyme A thioesterase PaaI-like protein